MASYKDSQDAPSPQLPTPPRRPDGGHAATNGHGHTHAHQRSHGPRRPLRDGAQPSFERSRLLQDTLAVVPELADAAPPRASIDSTRARSPPRVLVLERAPTLAPLLVFGSANEVFVPAAGPRHDADLDSRTSITPVRPRSPWSRQTRPSTTGRLTSIWPRSLLSGAAIDEPYVLEREEAASLSYTRSHINAFIVSHDIRSKWLQARIKRQSGELRRSLEGPSRLAECAKAAEYSASLRAVKTAILLPQPLRASSCLRHFPLGFRTGSLSVEASLFAGRRRDVEWAIRATPQEQIRRRGE
jgi:hypothetical protein